MSQDTFAALGVSAELIEVLAERGIATPFQIQTRAIPPALAGTDLLAKSPTGSGKTLAFAVPLVERVPQDDARPAALVLVPTRELALQVTEEIAALARARNLKVAAVYGGVSIRPQANAARDACGRAEHGRGLRLLQREEVLGVRLQRHQHVPRIDLADVHEREGVLVLVDHRRRDLLRHDPAEHAIAHVSPPGAW